MGVTSTFTMQFTEAYHAQVVFYGSMTIHLLKKGTTWMPVWYLFFLKYVEYKRDTGKVQQIKTMMS